ncbi:unnamed protein product [Alopecurus aequalis]
MDGRQWSDLPADVLREISGHFWASSDFVYFHAVCKPWRNSRDPPLSGSRTTTTTTQFLPWLLAPAQKEPADLKFWCVFSKACYRATPASPVPRRSWVCSADGTTVWYLTVENLRPSLHNPLTGEVTDLPLLRQHIGHWEKNNPRGVVYGEGSTFLYVIFRDGDIVSFKAALTNPGDTKWAVIERTFPTSRWSCAELYAAYNGGKIMVTVGAGIWHLITPDGHAHDVLVPKPELRSSDWASSRQYKLYNYLLESRGELLWAVVQVETNHGHDAHKMTMQWVRKDRKSLADRVLFLGWPNSLAVDASRLVGDDGGCAYIAYSGGKDLRRGDYVGVFRFNLISNTAEFIDRLPREWNEGRCTWIIPQPAITPVQQLTERKQIAREMKQQGQQHTAPITNPNFTINIERFYGPSFKAWVRNLPLTVTTPQLQNLLSKHGKVSNAEVLYYKKTKRAQGTAELTMSTIHPSIEDVVEALSALFLHGYPLDLRRHSAQDAPSSSLPLPPCSAAAGQPEGSKTALYAGGGGVVGTELALATPSY